MSRYVSEFLATFTMLLAILESILLTAAQGATVSLIVSAVTAGVAVTILIYRFGKLSGAHMNPAVSAAMWLDNRLTTLVFFGYVIAQLAGSLSAAWLVDFLHRDEFYVMGATVPTLSEGAAWIVEFVLTFLLVLLIFRTEDGRFPKLQRFAPVYIGLLVTIMIIIAGPYSGASFNPARSFGPAVMESRTEYHWLFFSAPLVGAAAARYFDLLFRKKTAVQPELNSAGE